MEELETTDKNIEVTTIGGSQIKLALGDIIQLIAPNHTKLHEQTFFIEYLDDTQVILFDVANLNIIQLNINTDGYLTDESIEKIYILSRSEEDGYARQNDLLPKTWIDIHIGGEMPVIITGQITNLDEDMIEITTYPEMDVIYIDFEYKGIPRNVPFERFEIRDKPGGLLGKQFSKSLSKEEGEEREERDNENEYPLDLVANSEDLRNHSEIEKTDPKEKDVFDILNSLYLEADELVFGEELEDIAQLVELPEKQRRYGIEIQANDMMDELLSTIPNSRRTKEILNRIHTLIERFKQLRHMFSKFDESGNVTGYVQLGPLHKPLVERIRNLDVKLPWIVPVVSQRRIMYNKSGGKNVSNNDDENDDKDSHLHHRLPLSVMDQALGQLYEAAEANTSEHRGGD